MEKKHQQESYVDFVVTARKYKTLLTAKYKNRPMWCKPSVGDVVSHLPGTIIKILVEKGQAVEAGQLLLTHEAMKMQNRVVAPIAGVVVELNVKEGDKITKNHLMVKIESK
ncbi:acetyl-CoA carboxylase biotin carboxyl carrier protein subunit [Parabacteroides sp. ZJ-118]|uniref:acetyl-CoA carboxylase biotin carboxyl carrier protein subunit n=1 Tax=Parabacteroides sp. ZJ-118 TaxID=2709398 RepID=UPI0013EC8F1A|nr:acetyl-CoA carboxylase biotin carboxyl carrier protein subunit [Parabacteroides sp. ZJ-118]